MVKRRDSIADRVTLSRRYVRATDVVRDLADPDALDGYVVTSSARDALHRLAAGLAPTSTQRAFRVTGPYGSGKSSFALLLARLSVAEGRSDASELVLRAGVPAAANMPAHDVLVMSGGRTSFARDLLALVAAQSAGVGLEAPAVPADADAGECARAALHALETFANAVFSSSGRRTLLVVDEMGRYVEHAAANPRSEDPSIFQQLAERASGAAGPPLAIVAILHHRFAEYVAQLGDHAQAEWTRSAERYEEIPFGDSLEQTVHLVAGAMRAEPPHTRAVTSAARALYATAASQGALSAGVGDVAAIAANLYPFHPATLAALSVATRRLGQNERSVFGFLQTLEPMGFQRFALDAPYGEDSWYRLPRLFDYFANQGSLRFGSADRERRWHLALDAVAQLESGTTEADVLRCIALIAVLEPLQSLRATPATLAWCTGVDEEQAVAALEVLAGRGLIYRRPQSADYSLWSRSSVDLDHWYQEAVLRVPAARRLDGAIAALQPARPLVAHAHYQASGTLRTFAVRPRSALDDTALAVPDASDGLIAVLAAHPDDDAVEITERARTLSADAGPMVLVNVHQVAAGDLEAASRFQRWRWVRENCPELRMDDLARAEVDAQVAKAEDQISTALASLTAPGGSSWFQGGKEIDVASRAGLSRRLSDTCNAVFDAAPILRNELVNRSKLSTAIASARMRLLEIMLERSSLPMLGLTGAPPERTIHLAMFQASGMHRETGVGAWGFMPPPVSHPLRWRPAWDRLGSLLRAGGSVTFDEISAQLAKAPWGLRQGPVMLLVAAYMLHHRTEIALMERNSFVPEITKHHFMRLAKNPSNFALRAVGGGDDRVELLERLSAGLDLPADVPRPAAEVKPIVEALYRWFARLPENALATTRVPPTAIAVRTALAKASDPMDVLFDQLPRACDCIADTGRIDPGVYLERLRAAMHDLGDVDPIRRRQAAAQVGAAFARADVHSVRRRLEEEYGPLRHELTDPPLRQFVNRSLIADTDDDRWVDGIAGLLAGRRIENWDDTSLDTFSFRVREVADRLSRWRFLKEKTASKRTEMVSIHLVSTSGEEKAVVVDGGEIDLDQVAQLRAALNGVAHPERLLTELLTELLETRGERIAS